MKINTTIVVVVISLRFYGVFGGGSSSISVYQSTSNIPPLAESYSEGACVIPQTAKKVDPKWVVRQSTFYVPIASQFTFRLYAETFLSRAGVSDQDIKSMCLTLDFFPDGPGVNVTNTGYDLREFKQTCPVIWRGQFTCLPVGGSPGTNSARARSTDNYVVSVDNQSYMLVVRCVDGFFRDYMLLTTRPVVSPELYHTVVSTIKDLGFDERKLQMVTYDTCLRTDRFVTALNVHHHHHHNHHHHGSSSSLSSSSSSGREHTVTIKAGGGLSLHHDRGSSGSSSSSVVGGSPGSSSSTLRVVGGGGGIENIIVGGGGVGGRHHHHHHHHSNQLRPSFGTVVGGSGGGGGGGSSRRISISGSPPISASIIASGGGGSGIGHGGETGGRGRTSTKVEEVEAFYAIIPEING